MAILPDGSRLPVPDTVAINPVKSPGTPLDIEHIFTYHSPDSADVYSYQQIRNAAKHLAETIVAQTPSCADQTAAIRLLRECVMTANASIALKGRLNKV